MKQQTFFTRSADIVFALLAFTPLIVVNNVLFPFVFPKGIFVYGMTTAAVVGVIVAALAYGWRRGIVSSVVAAAWLWVVALAVSAWFGVDVAKSVWGNTERMNGLVFFAYWAALVTAMVWHMRTSAQWQRLLRWHLIAMAAVAFFALMAVADVDLYINMNTGRVGGTLGNAAYLATYGLMGGILAGYAALRYPALRAWGWTGVGLGVFMIMLSATRGPLLALVLVGVGYALKITIRPSAKERPWRRTAGGIVAAMALVAVAVVALRDTAIVRTIPIVERVATINISEGTVYNRLRVWEYAIEAWRERPWFGWGLENFNVAFNTVYQSDLNEEWFDRSHNTFLDMAVMGGVVGLVVYLLVLFVVARRIWQLYRYDANNRVVATWLGLGFTAYILQNMFVFDTVTSYVLLAFLLAVIEYEHFRNRADYALVNSEPRINRVAAYGTGGIVFAAGLVLLYYTAVLPVQANNAAVDGIVAMREGDAQTAMDSFSRAFAYQSYGTDELLYRMGDIVAGMVEEQERYTYLDFAIEQFDGRMNDNELRHLYQLAVLYSAKARTALDPAVQQEYLGRYQSLIEEALQRYPGRHLLYSHRGRAALLAGDAETAVTAFSRAAELKGDGDSLWNVYIVHKTLQQEEAAREIVERFIADPQLLLPAEQWQTLAARYLEREEWDLSRRILERALQNHNLGMFHLLLAKAYDQLGDVAQAQHHLERAMELDSDIRQRINELTQ